ncbi:MAG: histidine kinase [Bacteroidetes bacterium SW_9_63_38]|nr:MAG: histidine kinase [Bacteroidetes bacterium SW_9_63_38]
MRPPSSASGRWLPPFVNRLALKIASPVVVVALAGGLWTAPSAGTAVLLSLLLGGVAYTAGHYWLHRPLRQMRGTLRSIRQHDFDAITAPSSLQDDELNLLFWEVYRTGQRLDNEIQELKERESYRREFIGNVSHELKTPIFSVQGFAETLLDGALDDEQVNRTFLEKILHNVTRLEHLARDLSAITKIETGEMEMSREPFDLAPLFQEIQESLELKAEEKEITLHTDMADEVSAAYADTDRIQRVLVNLVDNAIKYTDEGGTVTLRARPHAAEEVAFRVEDNGIGIPEEHLPRLTERFYRVDKSRSRNEGGTGLGLAIVKHILGAHDRDLRVESTPGEGSTFWFTLPTTSLPTRETGPQSVKT